MPGMDELTKSQKRALRELADHAYAEALRRALLPVGEAAEAWKAGAISSFEFSDRIHTFHQGPSRRLWSFYNTLDPRTIVVHAVAEGLVDIAAVPEDLRAVIQQQAAGLRQALKDES
jgi:hypothetical protein